jgi:hypothetical protein
MNKTRFAMLLAAALLPAAAAQADGERLRPATPNPSYQQECGGCHLAYPPALLPAASWQRITADLGKHYGSDASLDPATTQMLTRWLLLNAGSGKRARETPPQDRITRAAWFQRKHDELPAGVWQRPAVKSPANCAACHPGAEQGDFEEHRVRVPR